MLIKSIKLNNIRSYINETIEFPEGSVILSGDIGSGKSTILLALEFALFGIMKGSLEGTALLRTGKKQGSIEVELEIEGKEVIIKRNLKKTSEGIRQDSGHIIIDGIKTEGTAEELKSRVLELLGYPKELLTKSKSLIYRYTVYTPQEAMKQILTEEKEYRIDTLRKVFKIDRYKRIRENAAVVIKEIKTKVREQEARTEDINEKKVQKDNTKKELELTEKELKKLLPILEKNQKELKKQLEETRRLEEKIRQLNELKKLFGIHNSKLQEKNNTLKENEERIIKSEELINELKQKIQEIRIEESAEELELKEAEYNQLLEKTISTKQALKTLVEKKQEYNKELKDKNEKISSLKTKQELKEQLKKELEQKEELKQQLTKLEEELKEIREVIKEYQVIKRQSEEIKQRIIELEECPVCLQPVNQGHKEHIHLQETQKIEQALKILKEKLKLEEEMILKINNNKDRIESLIEKEKLLEKTIIEINNLQELGKDLAEKKELLLRLEEQEEELKAEIKKLGKVEELKEELQRTREVQKQLNEKKNLTILLLEKERNQRELQGKIEVIKKEIQETSTEIQKIEKEITKLRNIEQESLEEREELERIREQEKELLIKKSALSQKQEGLNSIIKELEAEIKRKEEIIKEIRHTKQFINWMETFFLNLMETMEKQVMFNIHQQFNELFQNWFSILMEGGTINARLDEEFTPIIEQNGYEMPIDNLSGGEKTSLALAYRLALNRVINDLITGIKTKDIIILDEPTDGFSNEQLEKVREVLEQLNTKQTIIVSHEAKLESFVQNIIRVYKHEHVSRIIT